MLVVVLELGTVALDIQVNLFRPGASSFELHSAFQQLVGEGALRIVAHNVLVRLPEDLWWLAAVAMVRLRGRERFTLSDGGVITLYVTVCARAAGSRQPDTIVRHRGNDGARESRGAW